MKSSRFKGESPLVVPILPLRDMVVFPNVMVPLYLKGARVVKLAESLVGGDDTVGLFFQRPANRLTASREEICAVGTLARIQQVVRLDGGGVKAIADGICRIRMTRQIQHEPYLMGEVTQIEEIDKETEMMDTLVSSVAALFKVSLTVGRTVSEHAISLVDQATEPGNLADLISAYLPLKPETKQSLLETDDTPTRLRKVFGYLNREIHSLQPRLQAAKALDPNANLTRRQKEQGLRRQMRAMQKDLNSQEDPHAEEIKELEEKIKGCGMSEEAMEVATREFQRLERIPPHSPEYTVSRTYLEVLTGLPWNDFSEDNLDINRAQEVLDEDHYNLTKVKDRILEFLAVHKMRKSNKGPILCLVGPPGVGKTSLGRSIARALGRQFIRVSLGGMRDEAEIRGHRRTYIGAMPGRVIQEIRRAGKKNPVFMLDEVDKLGQDFRGDPSSALLEVLDPEQNNSFGDHYLDVAFDLSSVMFIATANQLDPIPAPLRDRMEIIRIPGYTDEEKESIAKMYLIPKAIEENGLAENPVRITDEALAHIISGYTREAGVRNLEREVGSVCRKIVREITQDKPVRELIDVEAAEELLGPPKFFFDLAEETDQVGIATGLAWTESGGDIIFIEVTGFKGRKELTLTGSLGDVMQESARAAISYLRSSCQLYGLQERLLNETDIHIHVPAGAIPKDGPSAGITISVALASFFTGVPVRRDIAMTGEVTLRGRVLPIGGVKEKILAARRAGVKEIILPWRNKSNLLDLPDYVRDDLTIHFVKDVGEAIRLALLEDPECWYAAAHIQGQGATVYEEGAREYVLRSSRSTHNVERNLSRGESFKPKD